MSRRSASLTPDAERELRDFDLRIQPGRLLVVVLRQSFIDQLCFCEILMRLIQRGQGERDLRGMGQLFRNSLPQRITLPFPLRSAYSKSARPAVACSFSGILWARRVPWFGLISRVVLVENEPASADGHITLVLPE